MTKLNKNICEELDGKWSYEACKGVDLYKARMPKSNFERADLRSSDFLEANLSGAFFDNVIIDEGAIRSLLKNNYNRDLVRKVLGEFHD